MVRDVAESTENSLIMMPDHPFFQSILHGHIPPWLQADHHDGDHALVVDVSTGLLKSVDEYGMWDYVLGGEWDEVEDSYCDD